MAVLITGASGLVGRRLLDLLRETHEIVVTTRDASRTQRSLEGLGVSRIVEWDLGSARTDASIWEGVDAVIHLAGESVASQRWNDEVKRRIRSSRVEGTRAIVDSLEGLGADRPATFLCASAVGYYGDRGDERLPEESDRGDGFLADVCVEWEREAERATEFGVRVVCMRTGIVLDPAGGALGQMLPIFRWGLGGRLGSGRQWMPWIHHEDLSNLYGAALNDERFAGAVNASSPKPVRNSEFTRALGRSLRRPACLPVPKFALRIAVGELAGDLLASQRVVPERAIENGFEFAHGELEAALEQLLG